MVCQMVLTWNILVTSKQISGLCSFAMQFSIFCAKVQNNELLWTTVKLIWTTEKYSKTHLKKTDKFPSPITPPGSHDSLNSLHGRSAVGTVLELQGTGLTGALGRIQSGLFLCCPLWFASKHFKKCRSFLRLPLSPKKNPSAFSLAISQSRNLRYCWLLLKKPTAVRSWGSNGMIAWLKCFPHARHIWQLLAHLAAGGFSWDKLRRSLDTFSLVSIYAWRNK